MTKRNLRTPTEEIWPEVTKLPDFKVLLYVTEKKNIKMNYRKLEADECSLLGMNFKPHKNPSNWLLEPSRRCYANYFGVFFKSSRAASNSF